MGDERAALEWEARHGRRAGYAALGAAALALTGFAYRFAMVTPPGRGRAQELVLQDAEALERLVYATFNAAGLLLGGLALYYLYRAARHRRKVPSASGVLAVAGPVLIALTTLTAQYLLGSSSAEFLASGPRTDARAAELLRDGPLQTLSFVAQGGVLAYAFATVMISANALQAGLLSRFVGVLGVVLGFLYVLPLVPPTVVQASWFVAVGGVFLDRWPGGRGPAWAVARSVPWPGAAERDAAPAEVSGSDETSADAADDARPRASRKRRRGRR